RRGDARPPAAWWTDWMSLPWPVRSVVAGTAGTTTLTLAYAAERKLRTTRRGPLDYDDSLVPGQIVASVMHLPTSPTARTTSSVSHCGGATAPRSASCTACSDEACANRGRAPPSAEC